MGYLTNLLLLSAGLLPVSGRDYIVSGSSVPKGLNRRRNGHRGVDSDVEGQDYFIGGMIQPAIESAMPTILQHIESAIPGLIERNLPTLMDQALPIVMDHLEKDLPG